MKRISYIAVMMTALLLSAACNRGPGEGGRATVQGYVKLVQHPDDDFQLSADTVDASKTDVFIVYGDDAYFGDDVETGSDGFYRFEYLTSGTYTVYSYSTLASGEREAVSQTVSVKSGDVAIVPTIYIHSGKSYGTSIIKGKVMAAYYDGSSYLGEGYAYEHRVYIRKAGDDTHFDDVRVGADGVYAFQKIQPGEYEVYTFTEDNDGLLLPDYKQVTVSEAGQIIELPDFIIRLNI